MDFWKGMCLAQTLIYVAYLMYGCFLYGYQVCKSLHRPYTTLSMVC